MYLEIAAGLVILSTWIYHRYHQDPGPRVLPVATPTVSQSATVPLVYGRCRVRAPVLAWSGSQRSIPRPNGRRAYFVDMLYVVGIPFNGGGARLRAIYAGDVVLTLNAGSGWPFTTVDSNGGVPSVPVFGSPASDKFSYWVDNKPARVFQNDLEIMVNYGFVEFFAGSPGQLVSGANNFADPISDTEAVLRADPLNKIYEYLNDDFTATIHYTPEMEPGDDSTKIPSYRNMATCCMYHWCNGDGITLPNYNFEIESLSTGTSSDLGTPSLTTDADPAAVIYDLLTSPWGKLGLSTDLVDLPSFQAASATLYAERHGYSRAIEESDEASNIIDSILRQIDGVLYPEPTTGKLVLKLIRNDYDVNILETITPDNARPVDGSWFSVSGWSESINQVRIKFDDRDNFHADGLVIGQNTANVVSQGGRLRSVDIDFPGCCTRDLAQKLAGRELAVVSRPQLKVSVITSRAFYQARPGSVYKFTWPQLGITNMVMRVARVDLGQLHKGEIHIDLIRDIFDVSSGAFPYQGAGGIGVITQ